MTDKIGICYSPLQAISLMSLSAEYNLFKMKIIYITYNDTSQDRYYFQRLVEFYQNGSYLSLKNKGIFKTNNELEKLLQSLIINNHKVSLFISSINQIFSHIIINKIPNLEINLFTDGIFQLLNQKDAEIVFPQMFNENLNFFKKIYYFFFRKNININSILKKTICVFSNYDDYNNSFYINLEKKKYTLKKFILQNYKFKFKKKQIVFFLGLVTNGYPKKFQLDYSIILI